MKKIFLALVVLMLLYPVYADMAMPPLVFHVLFNGSSVNGNFSAAKLGCYSGEDLADIKNATYTQRRVVFEENDTSKNCTWYPIPREEAECDYSMCSFYGGFYPEYRLAFYLPSVNRVFVSGSENRTYGEFQVNISSSGEVRVGGMPPRLPLVPTDELAILAYALVLTTIVELMTSFIYLHLRRLSKSILLSVVLVNIISVPLLWFFLKSAPFLLALCFTVPMGEFMVFVFEAIAIYVLNRKKIGPVDAFAMSFINNAASFLAGILLLILLSLA
jgi:hypothetical protein